jgi:hypothetical protein
MGCFFLLSLFFIKFASPLLVQAFIKTLFISLNTQRPFLYLPGSM